MATEYKFPYTGSQINEKLNKIDSLALKSELPTKTSDLTNDSGFADEEDLFVALNRYDVIDVLVDNDGAYLADEFEAVLFGDDECTGIDNDTLEETKAEIYVCVDEKIADSKPCDYVIESGTSGIWTYEKWHSGKAICFGTYNETLTNYTEVNGFKGYYSSKVAYPSGLFISPPIMMHSSKVGNGFVIDGGDVQNSKNYATAYALCTTSGEAQCIWKFYCVGRWK